MFICAVYVLDSGSTLQEIDVTQSSGSSSVSQVTLPSPSTVVTSSASSQATLSSPYSVATTSAASQALLPSPYTVVTSNTSANILLGRWRLCVELFGRVFLEDVGAEPCSVLNELGRFDVKETKFRREMERLRNSTQRDFTLEVSF